MRNKVLAVTVMVVLGLFAAQAMVSASIGELEFVGFPSEIAVTGEEVVLVGQIKFNKVRREYAIGVHLWVTGHDGWFVPDTIPGPMYDGEMVPVTVHLEGLPGKAILHADDSRCPQGIWEIQLTQATPTPTPTSTPTPTATSTATPRPTDTPTPTPTPTETWTPTNTPTSTPTPTEPPPPTPTSTLTVAPTETPTPTATLEPTVVPTDEPTATPSPTPTTAPTEAPTEEPEPETGWVSVKVRRCGRPVRGVKVTIHWDGGQTFGQGQPFGEELTDCINGEVLFFGVPINQKYYAEARGQKTGLFKVTLGTTKVTLELSRSRRPHRRR